MDKSWVKNYQTGVPASIEDQISKYQSIVDLLEQSFKNSADRDAFHCMGENLSYSEIDQLSLNFASFLQNQLGLKKGDRVALMMPNILQYPIALFGVLRAGMVVVNVNPLYTARELELQLKDSGAIAIVVFENAAHILELILTKTDVKHVMVTSIGDMLSFPKSVIVNLVIKKIKKMVPKWSIPNAINFVDSLKQGIGSKFVPPSLCPNDIAFLQYTGGTTGIAKGAILLHKNIVANICQARAWLSPVLKDQQNEIIVSPLPLYHIFSLTVSFVYASIGAKNILITNPRDMGGFVKELKKWKFTAIAGVNTLFNGLLNNLHFKEVDFSSTKICLGGGMAVQSAVAKKWKEVTGKVLIEAYGLTETSPAACINPLDIKEFNGFIGLPISSTTVVIMDDEEKILEPGEIGEICIKGPQVMAGYWNNPTETSLVMGQGGYFKTGDLGLINKNGYVKVVDRKKDMIIVSGFNVYPNEIEEVVSLHPKVFEVAVIGVHDEITVEAVKLFIVKKDQTLEAEEIIKYCREYLTNYKIPRHVEFRLELPKTNVGKILKKDLRS